MFFIVFLSFFLYLPIYLSIHICTYVDKRDYYMYDIAEKVNPRAQWTSNSTVASEYTWYSNTKNTRLTWMEVYSWENHLFFPRKSNDAQRVTGFLTVTALNSYKGLVMANYLTLITGVYLNLELVYRSGNPFHDWFIGVML